MTYRIISICFLFGLELSAYDTSWNLWEAHLRPQLYGALKLSDMATPSSDFGELSRAAGLRHLNGRFRYITQALRHFRFVPFGESWWQSSQRSDCCDCLGVR